MKQLLACLLLSAIVPMTTNAVAQTKVSMSGSCSKADTEYSIPAGDKENHSFVIASGKCKSHVETRGLTSETATYSEHREETSSFVRAWGVYVETYNNGDKISYPFTVTFPITKAGVQPGTATYHASFGTGTLKGVKAAGKCVYTLHPDHSSEFKCDKSLEGE